MLALIASEVQIKNSLLKIMRRRLSVSKKKQREIAFYVFQRDSQVFLVAFGVVTRTYDNHISAIMLVDILMSLELIVRLSLQALNYSFRKYAVK